MQQNPIAPDPSWIKMNKHFKRERITTLFCLHNLKKCEDNIYEILNKVEGLIKRICLVGYSKTVQLVSMYFCAWNWSSNLWWCGVVVWCSVVLWYDCCVLTYFNVQLSSSLNFDYFLPSFVLLYVRSWYELEHHWAKLIDWSTGYLTLFSFRVWKFTFHTHFTRKLTKLLWMLNIVLTSYGQSELS